MKYLGYAIHLHFSEKFTRKIGSHKYPGQKTINQGIMQKPLFEPAYTAALFDMDNTLFDFTAAMKRGAAAATEVIGEGTGDQLFSYYLRRRFRIDDHANLQDFMMDHHKFTVDGFLAAVKAFEDAKFAGLIPYPGISTLLTSLKKKGYRIGIVTDAYEYAAIERLRRTALVGYFDAIVTYDAIGYRKPHPAPFEYAMDLLMTQPHETVCISASIRYDIEPAQSLGIAAIYAAYGDRGFFGQNRYCPPRVIVAHSPNEIESVLL
jgi:putative hydrolase of the HAD superfamily